MVTLGQAEKRRDERWSLRTTCVSKRVEYSSEADPTIIVCTKRSVRYTDGIPTVVAYGDGK